MTFEQIQQRAAATAKALADYQHSSGAMARYNYAGFTARVDELQREANEAQRALANAQHENAQQDLINSVLADAQANGVRLEQERVAAEQAQQAQREAAFKSRARSIYIDANGSAYGFEESWPATKAEFVKKHVLAQLDEAKAESDPVAQFITKMNQERGA